MRNKCNDCKFAKWDMASVDNAFCEQNPIHKVFVEGNYISYCSSYQTTNIIKRIISWIENVFN